jgi:biotin operon repressor
MASNPRNKSDFTETLAIHAALRQTLKSPLFRKDARVLRAARRVIQSLESERSIYGRQLKMIQLMQAGATIETMGKRLRCSRRTLFRYLNHLQAAGIEIWQEGRQYKVAPDLLKLIRG